MKTGAGGAQQSAVVQMKHLRQSPEAESHHGQQVDIRHPTEPSLGFLHFLSRPEAPPPAMVTTPDIAASHSQEPTAVSFTDTIAHDYGSRGPALVSALSGTTFTTNPELPEPIHWGGRGKQRHPERRDRSINPEPIPHVIPPTHNARTLVLCFDGTSDQFDEDNTNVVQLMSLLAKGDRTKQMVYYQAGIGTYTSEKDVSPWKAMIQKTLDEMVAWNLDEHVKAGYEFLMQNYLAGDRICIFGFSRGAHTARSLAGMLQKVGLLPADNWQQVPFAYKMYTQTDNEGFALSASFKKTFSIDVDVEFLGVWDTVASVGLIPKTLPFTFSNNIVRTFRHALSLDEHRCKFTYEPWHHLTKEDLDHQQMCRAYQPSPSPLAWEDKGKAKRRGSTRSSFSIDSDIQKQSILEREYADTGYETSVEEVWFAGCHCDIGGGSVRNGTRHTLSKIPLRWMVRECFRANSGIMFNSKGLRAIGLDPSTIYPEVLPRPPALSPKGMSCQIVKKPSLYTRVKEFLKNGFRSSRRPKSLNSSTVNGYMVNDMGTEEEEDLEDCLAPVYDQLKLQPMWWTLEYLPMKFGTLKGMFKIHRGRPRTFRHDQGCQIKLHRTVRTRMEAQCPRDGEGRYVPAAGCPQNITWVD